MKSIIALILVSTYAQLQPPVVAQSSSTSPLGVRYSAATDVSHISFNSPLVTYGTNLNEIQLPAAPIQPTNLKQSPQETTKAPLLQDNQAQQVQASPPQFISVQQYPANPQLQSLPQSLSASQNSPGHQPQVLPQQQYNLASTPYATQNTQSDLLARQLALQGQQYNFGPTPYATQYAQNDLLARQLALQTQQQYNLRPNPYATQYTQSDLLARQLALQQYLGATPGLNGPYAPQYSENDLLARQHALTQYAQSGGSPAPQTVSTVTFNRPTAGFSYSF